MFTEMLQKSSASFRCRRRQKTKSSFAALWWRKCERNIRNITRYITDYFTQKKNREYEVYVFRKPKQESDESISAFHTRLRRLAMTCEFANTDREINTQIVQNCLSHKLCMKALQNPDLTLTQLLEAGKAMEMSKTQAENIEGKQEINKM